MTSASEVPSAIAFVHLMVFSEDVAGTLRGG